MATLVAGGLGIGAHHLASLSGPTIEPILLAIFVFVQGNSHYNTLTVLVWYQEILGLVVHNLTITYMIYPLCFSQRKCFLNKLFSKICVMFLAFFKLQTSKINCTYKSTIGLKLLKSGKYRK